MTGKAKKENSKARDSKVRGDGLEKIGEISSAAELKAFLLSVRDRLVEGSIPAIYALTAMNHVMSLQLVYSCLDNENKELARDIWLRIKQSGMQVCNPPMLFSPEEEDTLPGTL